MGVREWEGSGVSAAGPTPPNPAGMPPGTPPCSAAAPGCGPVSGKSRKGTALGWCLSRRHLRSFYAPGLCPQWVRDVTLAVRFLFPSFPKSCLQRHLTRPSSEPWIRARWRERSGGTPTWSPCWGEFCAPRAPEAGSARTQGASGCTWSAGAENRGDISAKVILKKWFFLILPFKNTLGGSLRLGCGLRTMNRIRSPDSQFVGFGLVSLSFMPLGNAAVVKEGEDERGRKWVCKWGRKVCKEGGNECVSEAAMGPVQGLVSAFPSACAMD